MALLNRDDVLSGLRELIAEIHAAGEPATIRIVGGSAMALKYDEFRAMSQDVDALRLLSGSESVVLAAAARVGRRHDWPDDWFNFKVAEADAEPTLGERRIQWETVYDREKVVLQIADAESMLAMKLRSNRPGRDTADLRQLLALCDVTSVEQAGEFYGEFYPGDSLSDRAWALVENILADGPLRPRPLPGDVDLG